MKVEEGEINAITRISSGARGNRDYSIYYLTRKEASIAYHLTSLGFPIINDPLYPEVQKTIHLRLFKAYAIIGQATPLSRSDKWGKYGVQIRHRLEW